MQRMTMLRFLLLASLLLVGSTEARLLQQQTASATYSDLWTAVTTELWAYRELKSGELRGNMPTMLMDPQWNRYHSQLIGITTNPKLKVTGFLPGSEKAWRRMAKYRCLTVDELAKVLISNPKMSVAYMLASLVPGAALNSSKFTDGMVLRTMDRTVKLTLSKRTINGTDQWVFRNASHFKIPASFDYEDVMVIPANMNIKAGASWLHLIDKPIRIDGYEPFWADHHATLLQHAGLPANSTGCPDQQNAVNPGSSSPSATSTRLAIGVAVGGACFVAIVSTAAIILTRRARKERQHSEGALLPAKHPASARSEKGSQIEAGLGATHSSKFDSASMQDQAGYSSGFFASKSGRAPPSGFTSSPFAMFLFGQPEPLVMLSMQQVSTGAKSNQHSTSGGQLPSPSRSSTVSGSPSGGSRQIAQGASSGTGTKQAMSCTAGSRPCRGSMATCLSLGHACCLQMPEREFEGADLGDSAYQAQDGLLSIGSAPVGQIPHAHVIPLSELSLDDLIGKGAEGKVYRGTWKYADIAAKEYLPPLTASGDDSPLGADEAVAAAQAALEKEVYWLMQLNHPNLVRFCAVCLERPMVVMEYYKNGSVFDIIHKAEVEMGGMSSPTQQSAALMCCSTLSWDRRLMMLHDVAAGMSYLHGRSHIHGDLRSPNLFVGADGTVKIGDFGFTKRVTQENPSLKVARITHPRWVAPELLTDNMLSLASDVYSFGIVMYELLTFKVPFEELRKEQVVLEVMRGARPQLPTEESLPPGTSSGTCLWSYIRLMQECWAQDAAARPTFEVIARRIQAMQRWRKVISKMRPASDAACRALSLPTLAGLGGVAASLQSAGGQPADAHSAPTVCRDQGVSAAQQQQQQQLSPVQQQPQSLPVLPQVVPLPSHKGFQPLELCGADPVEQDAASGRGPALQAHARIVGLGAASAAAAGVLQDERRQQQQQQQQQQFAVQGHGTSPAPAAGMLPSCVEEAGLSLCSAFVHGERLAIIPTCPAACEFDALASIADPAQIAAARVLLVASDLPSRYVGLAQRGSGCPGAQ